MPQMQGFTATSTVDCRAAHREQLAAAYDYARRKFRAPEAATTTTPPPPPRLSGLRFPPTAGTNAARPPR